MIFEMPINYILLILIVFIVVVVLGLFKGGAFQTLDFIKGMLGA
jgi:hypothetical protein